LRRLSTGVFDFSPWQHFVNPELTVSPGQASVAATDLWGCPGSAFCSWLRSDFRYFPNRGDSNGGSTNSSVVASKLMDSSGGTLIVTDATSPLAGTTAVMPAGLWPSQIDVGILK